MLGVHQAEELTSFFDADPVVLPVLALDEPRAVLLEDEIDTAVRAGPARVAHAVAGPPIGFTHEVLELLPGHGADGMNAGLMVEQVALLPVAEE